MPTMIPWYIALALCVACSALTWTLAYSWRKTLVLHTAQELVDLFEESTGALTKQLDDQQRGELRRVIRKGMQSILDEENDR